MISFLLCLAILIVGYFVYGKIVDNTFGPDDRETPAVRILVYYFIATFISIDAVIGKIYPIFAIAMLAVFLHATKKAAQKA